MSEVKRIYFVTGRPGIGKTTLVKKLLDYFKDKVKVCGFITLEVREAGSRIGFKIVNTNGDEDWLAHISMFRNGPRIGKYRVNLDAIENIAIKFLENYSKDAQLIIIDEIGPMELQHPKFLPCVKKVLELGKPVVATIHIKYNQYPELRNLVNRNDAVLVTLNESNRNQMYQIIKARIESLLKIT